MSETKFIDWTDGLLASTLMTAVEMQDSSLLKCIDRIKSYNADITVVTDDYAPLSFQFGIYKRTEQGQHRIDGEQCQLVMNGGIIYHGKHDGGGNGSAPTFSVNLSPVTGWTIHT